MINLTNSIIINAEGDALQNAIKEAIKDTHRTLLSYYAPGNQNISLEEITASRDCRYTALAFNRYIPNYQMSFDDEWVMKVFNAVHNNTGRRIRENPLAIINEVIPGESIPGTLANEIWRGLRIFLLALWSNRAVLLPMTFSLPATSRKHEFSAALYTEVLAIYRRPFVDGLTHVHDVSRSITFRARKNFKAYSWRPIIASDWHTVEDINTEDLIALFDEIAKRANPANKNINSPVYPLTVRSFLAPLIENIPERCRFDTKNLSIYNCSNTLSTYKLKDELSINNYETEYPEIKAEWVGYQQRYLAMLNEIKRYKSTKSDEAIIGKFNHYLFSLLPQAGHTPPSPSDFGRSYMEGIGVPPLRTIISKRDDVTKLERFFRFLEEISPSEASLHDFSNPIVGLDKPRERRRRKTNKKTFRINDFRLFYCLIHAIGEFTWHILKKICEGDAPSNWSKLLNDTTRNSVINTEDFGFVPILRYTQMDGSQISVNLRWLPICVFPTIYVHTRKSPDMWTLIPDMHGIHQTIVGMETGLRHIHIRWLDKRTFKNSIPEHGAGVFDLLVNTDKVTNEWVRPTATTVLTALERQITSQSWIASDHFDTELFYDYHELSDFGKIVPIFMSYKEARVYPQESMARFFRFLMYFFNQIKISLGQPISDVLPEEVSNLKFDNEYDFKRGMAYRNKFKSEYTPHGLRASVVSAYAPLLPPHIIGNEITGHTNENTVRYYTVIDSDYINDLKEYNLQLISKCAPSNAGIFSIRADSSTSCLSGAIMVSPMADVLRDYGAFSFSSEEASGEIKSGVSSILVANHNDIVVNPTHICPLGNQCPPEIVSSIGKNSCGQCHYSVKTVDHLPRILSHCRFLSRQLDHANAQLKNASNRGASEEALETLENSMVRMAGEVAAWGLTAKVLVQNYELLKDRVLLNEPEIFKSGLIESIKPDSSLENLFVQCEEAAAYPELADSVLIADVAMARSRILAITGSIEELFAPLDNYQILDNFRGIFRGICIATGKSPKELAEHIEKRQDFPTAILNALEKIYD